MPLEYELTACSWQFSLSVKKLVEGRGALLTVSGSCTNDVAQFRSRGDEN